MFGTAALTASISSLEKHALEQPSLGRWTAITGVSQWANRSKSGSLILCSTHGCERGGFELPGAHTSQHLISPMSNASTWSAGCFPVGCLVSPQDALFPSCHQESFTSPPSVCCGASSLPGRQAGSGFLFSPPCLTFLSGSWEEAVSQDKWQT